LRILRERVDHSCGDDEHLIEKNRRTGPVLIIEDDPDIAEILRYILENENLETRIARTGEEGLSACLDKHNPPSLILLDLLLPGMSGIEICRRLRGESLTRSTPVVIVTAKASDTDLAMTLKLGVDDYITKPFSVEAVVARVKSLIRARQVIQLAQ
jgi:DNA-binding response OmpR family regulator